MPCYVPPNSAPADVTPSGYTPAPELAKYYRALLAMPRDMPAPLVMLQKLWQLVRGLLFWACNLSPCMQPGCLAGHGSQL